MRRAKTSGSKRAPKQATAPEFAPRRAKSRKLVILVVICRLKLVKRVLG